MTAQVWPFAWQNRVTESLEWKTNVIRMRSGEQRLCLRTRPRQEFQLDFAVSPSAFGRARELAKSIGGDELLLPVWQELTHVGAISAHAVSVPVDATYASYVEGDYLLVWQSDTTWEACQIATIGEGIITLDPWVVEAYSDAYVMPLRTVTFAQDLEAQRDAFDDIVKMRARFVAVDTEDLGEEDSGFDYPIEGGYEIITDPPELAAGSVNERFYRETGTLDTGSGKLARTALYGQAFQTSMLGWYVETRASMWSRRVWLHQKKGRQKAFWTLSWANDLQLARNISPGDSFIEVTAIGYATIYPLPSTVCVVTRAGSYIPVTVTSVTYDGAPGTERLQFAGAFSGGTVTVAEVLMTCRMVLSRLDSDRVEIQHKAGMATTLAVPIIEVPT